MGKSLDIYAPGCNQNWVGIYLYYATRSAKIHTKHKTSARDPEKQCGMEGHMGLGMARMGLSLGRGSGFPGAPWPRDVSLLNKGSEALAVVVEGLRLDGGKGGVPEHHIVFVFCLVHSQHGKNRKI